MTDDMEPDPRGDTESPGYGYGLWVSAALGKGKAKGALGTIDPPNTHCVPLYSYSYRYVRLS